MRVEHFAYDLPAELIAQEATPDREQARLLVVEDESLVHTSIARLAEHVPAKSLIVVNDTRVIRARILGTKEGSGGKAEIFLIRKEAAPEPRSDGTERWRAMARASKVLRPSAKVIAGPLV